MANGTIKKTETVYTNQYRVEEFGATTSITPTHNGWLTAHAQVTSQQTIQPILRINCGTALLAEAIGLVVNTTALNASCPVQAGKTYTLEAYRCSPTAAWVYY